MSANDCSNDVGALRRNACVFTNEGETHRLELIDFATLHAVELDAWRGVRYADPAKHTPYFNPARGGGARTLWTASPARLLFARSTLLAAHFGLRSGILLHWFPALSWLHNALGPGWMLMHEVIAAAPVNGLTRIDLDRGDKDWKCCAFAKQLVLRPRADRRSLPVPMLRASCRG
jgi:hypothetical protein